MPKDKNNGKYALVQVQNFLKRNDAGGDMYRHCNNTKIEIVIQMAFLQEFYILLHGFAGVRTPGERPSGQPASNHFQLLCVLGVWHDRLL
jgi:hypothetical protein